MDNKEKELKELNQGEVSDEEADQVNGGSWLDDFKKYEGASFKMLNALTPAIESVTNKENK